jgi:hypothetical protein
MMRPVRIAAMALVLALPAAAAAETLVEKLLRVSGLTASPAQMRSPGEEVTRRRLGVPADGGTPTALTRAALSPAHLRLADGGTRARGTRGAHPAGGGAAPAQRAPIRSSSGLTRHADDFVLLDGGAPLVPVGEERQAGLLPYDAVSDVDRRTSPAQGQSARTAMRRSMRRRASAPVAHHSDRRPLRRGTALPRNAAPATARTAGSRRYRRTAGASRS